MLFTIPRSPRWLVKKQRIAEAREVLKMTGDASYERDLQEISASIDAEHGHADEPLFSARHRLPIFLAVSIAFFNQFAGINAILYYLNDIFASAGFSKVSSSLQAVFIGLTNLIFTMIAMSVIDKFGRKKLLLIGAVGTSLCLLGVAGVFAYQPADLAAGHLYRLLRVLAGRGNLGLHQRSVSESSAGERTKPGQLHPLDYGGSNLAGISGGGKMVEAASVRFLCCDHSVAILCSAAAVSGN